MKLSYRLVEKEDLPRLQTLWQEDSGWGPLAEAMWQHYVVDAPMGGASGTVAIDVETDRIVGEFMFMPTLVSVNGRQVRAFRPGAPILAKSCRFRSANPFSHPVVAMYRYAVKALRERGDGLIYMVPDPRWVRLFKMFPFLKTGSFPLWRMDLPLQTPLSLGEGFTSTPLQTWDDRVDGLWEKARQQHRCMVVRDSRTLPWKLGVAQYEVLAVERYGELVGLTASRQRKDEEQWLVCELLAADNGDCLRATLASVANLAHSKVAESQSKATPLRKVTVLVNSSMEPVVRSLGFVRDDYDFPFVVHVLDESLPADDVKPDSWFVTAND